MPFYQALTTSSPWPQTETPPASAEGVSNWSERWRRRELNPRLKSPETPSNHGGHGITSGVAVGSWRVVAGGRVALGTLAARPGVPRGLSEAELLSLQVGVPERGDDDQPVTGPLGGLSELEVKRVAGWGDHGAVREGQLAG